MSEATGVLTNINSANIPNIEGMVVLIKAKQMLNENCRISFKRNN